MSISIKIFSDFTCPFCYLGKGLVEALKREYDIHEEWVSYELHPEVPPEGVLLSEKFPDYDLEGLFQELRTKGARYGYTFGNVTLLPNTRKALEAGEFARDQGKHATFHAAVFHAYFGENRNIGQIPVLLDIASRVGLDRDTLERALNEDRYQDRLEASHEEGDRCNVSVLPTFVFDGGEKIVGLRSIEAFRQVLKGLHHTPL